MLSTLSTKQSLLTWTEQDGLACRSVVCGDGNISGIGVVDCQPEGVCACSDCEGVWFGRLAYDRVSGENC